MNKEEIINKLLQKSLTYLENTEQFMKGEIPKYVEELMSFKVIEHLVEGFSPSLGFTLFFWLIAMLFVLPIHGEFKKIWLCVLYSVFVFILIFTTSLMVNSEDFVQAYKAYSAPRVYLIDYIKSSK